MKRTVYCVLDRSGSMADCLDDTIGGYNTFLKEQDPDTVLSLTLFDNKINQVYKKSVRDIEPLNTKTYVPRGGTALLDAIGKVIKSVPIDETPSIVILRTATKTRAKGTPSCTSTTSLKRRRRLGGRLCFSRQIRMLFSLRENSESQSTAHSRLTLVTWRVRSGPRRAGSSAKQLGRRKAFGSPKRRENFFRVVL